MNAPSRMPLVLAFLIGVFVAATGLATAMLASLRDPLVLAVAAIAGLACVAAAVIAWLVLRGVQQQEVPGPGDIEEQDAAQERQPRIHALPAAELPPAYVAAVMKGIAANRAAMRSRELH